MSKVDLATFDAAVFKYFQPIANALALPMMHPKGDMYEIASPYFILRIRFCMGHGKSILATLMPAIDRPADINDESKEYGIGVIMGFNGETFRTKQVSDVGEFLEQAAGIAGAVEKFAIPYLLGGKTDFDKIREYVRQLVTDSGIEQKKWHFPKNVREEWLLPEK